MNDDDRATRFHGWLREHAPHGAPPGLLARALAGLDADASQRTSRWPLLRAAVLVPSFASLLVVALVAAMVMLTLPRGTPPIAEGTASPTETPTASADASAEPSWEPSVAPSPSVSPSEAPTLAPTADPTPVPTPTPTPWPLPEPTPRPPIVGPPGTLTVRVTIDAMPPGTVMITASFLTMNGPIAVDPLPNPFVFCGGSGGQACSVPGTYEQQFSGFSPSEWVAAFVGAKSASGGTFWAFVAGQWRADGSLVRATYPATEPVLGPPTCSGEHSNLPHAVGFIDADSVFVVPENMCVTELVWSSANRVPTSGTATLLRDGTPIFALDLAEWFDVGAIGGGSGEPGVFLAPPIPVGKGQTLSLAFSGCSTCVSEHVNVSANGTTWP